MKYLKLTSLLLITILLLISCNKDTADLIKKEAIIVYEGNPAVDGCGYVLLIDENKYKAIELNKEFTEDSLIVNVEYLLLDSRWTCNWQENKYSEIKIINISKK